MYKLNHHHLPVCLSTQKYLIENFTELPFPSLITTDEQVKGVGRKGNEWLSNPTSLTFSFSLLGLEPLTLTPLEIGVLLCRFFKENFNKELLLKWPNDLMNINHEKVGGIICNHMGDGKVVVGVGINGEIDIHTIDHSKFPPGNFLDASCRETGFKKNLPMVIAEYILSHRLSSNNVQSEWPKFCFHLDKKVKLVEGDSVIEGTFKCVGTNGEAVISNRNNEEIAAVAGSLFILN